MALLICAPCKWSAQPSVIQLTLHCIANVRFSRVVRGHSFNVFPKYINTTHWLPSEGLRQNEQLHDGIWCTYEAIDRWQRPFLRSIVARFYPNICSQFLTYALLRMPNIAMHEFGCQNVSLTATWSKPLVFSNWQTLKLSQHKSFSRICISWSDKMKSTHFFTDRTTRSSANITSRLRWTKYHFTSQFSHAFLACKRGCFSKYERTQNLNVADYIHSQIDKKIK